MKFILEHIGLIQEISYTCSFNSVNYFSRQFKKNCGYAPGQIDDLGK